MEERGNQDSTSINKYISSSGMCSRREADALIKEGKVTINGKKAELGNRVIDKDIVKVNGRKVSPKAKAIYIAYNKPVGIVSTTDSKEPKNIVKAVGHKERLFPIGRLDKPSQGLIFLTNDGDIVNKILRATNHHEKEYLVTVDKAINAQFIKKMSSGIPILGTTTLPCKVTQMDAHNFIIVLTQGLNRQIRRMTEYLGYEVTQLERIRIMNITLQGIKSGQWRYLSSKEVREIQNLVSDSTKTASETQVVTRPKRKSLGFVKKSGQQSGRKSSRHSGRKVNKEENVRSKKYKNHKKK
ncbi:23S rRNA pseudouridine(2604) synthase RluF [Membranihabitans marinus]|uniref:23S rRNA pseudouridine(2604) synthase RluF n=1 Tax=Membranihabitans marinus TaxID=1227546 RepID=UPI001EFF75FD|nr:23S rRNA pseudouridine(2604) synthase RluF [Membranihabitans marinus]